MLIFEICIFKSIVTDAKTYNLRTDFFPMLTDVLVTLIIAASFALGQMLYFWAQEEVDWLKNRFKSPALSKAKHFALVTIGLLGLVQGLATNTNYFEIASLLLLITALCFGSLVIAEKDKKLAFKYTAETVVTYLVFFAVIYFLMNLELIF